MKKNTSKTKPAKFPRIKKGDEVIVISGNDKPKPGEKPVVRRVLEVYPKTNRVLVEGAAVAKRSYKKGANPDFADGGIHDKEMPIHISNVMLADPKTGQPTRAGMRVEEEKSGSQSRVRYAKGSGTAFKN